MGSHKNPFAVLKPDDNFHQIRESTNKPDSVSLFPYVCRPTLSHLWKPKILSFSLSLLEDAACISLSSKPLLAVTVVDFPVGCPLINVLAFLLLISLVTQVYPKDRLVKGREKLYSFHMYMHMYIMKYYSAF